MENNYNAIATFKRIINGERKAARDRNKEAEAVNSESCLEDDPGESVLVKAGKLNWKLRGMAVLFQKEMGDSR